MWSITNCQRIRVEHIVNFASLPTKCTLVNEVLYRISFFIPYISPKEGHIGSEENSCGICGNHIGAKNLSFKVIVSYFWATLQDTHFVEENWNLLEIYYGGSEACGELAPVDSVYHSINRELIFWSLLAEKWS